VEIAYSPVRYLIQHGICMALPISFVGGRGRDLPWMMNARLVNHSPVATAATTLFLFQIAKLEVRMDVWFGSYPPGSGGIGDLHTQND